jgi:hypothetical protein
VKVKKGASIDDCRAPILRAAIVIEPIFISFGAPELVITSGSEVYKHSAERSAHYRGDAIDTRSKTVDNAPALAVAVQAELGPDYVVILENHQSRTEHIHIHWSPVYGGST